MEITFERNVPLPVRGSFRGALRALEASDSIFVAKGNYDSLKSMVSQIKAEFEGKRRFTTSKVDGGVRIWRLP